MPIVLYGVYLARFRFIESGAYKPRPVVIISQPRGEYKILLTIPLSSNPIKEDVDVSLEAWESSGLIKPTVARVHRLTAVIGNNILEFVGQLEQKDIVRIKQSLQKTFEL